MRRLTVDQVLELLSEAGQQTCGQAMVIVAAHPDDEVIGAGAQLLRWRGARFIHVTDGAPANMLDARKAGFGSRERYAQVRRQEMERALSLVGAHANQTRALNIRDQEASMHLAELARSLAELFRQLQPELVMTHPYEGGHPDHDATCFAAHTACYLLEGDGCTAPALAEMTSYHNRAGRMAAGEFLPQRESSVITLSLGAEQRAFKRQLFDCFATQHQVLAGFPIDRERFRAAPDYDFSLPPHDGVLYYEMFDWGMTGARWRSLARQALVDLGIENIAATAGRQSYVVNGA